MLAEIVLTATTLIGEAKTLWFPPAWVPNSYQQTWNDSIGSDYVVSDEVPEKVSREEASDLTDQYLNLNEQFNELYRAVWRLKGKHLFDKWEKTELYWEKANPLLRQLNVLAGKIEKLEDSEDFKSAMFYWIKPFEECEFFLFNRIYRRRFEDEFFRKFIEPNPMTYQDVLEDMLKREKENK